jgi:outer membrane protein assembly factor BamB
MRLGIAAILACVLLAIGGASGAAWSATGTDVAGAYQMDAAHDGDQPSDPLAPPLARSWAIDLPSSQTNPEFAYPLVADGRVIVGGWRYRQPPVVWCVDLHTGQRLWGPKDVGSFVARWIGLTYDGGTVFTVIEDGTVTALDPASGATKWSTPLGITTDAEPVAVAGSLYVVSAGKLTSLDEANGRVKWQRPINGGIHSTPAVDGGRIFVSGSGEQVQAFDTSGNALWTYGGYGSADGARAVAIHNGKVYVRDGYTHSDALIVLDAATGSVVGPSFHATTIPAFNGNTGYFIDNGELTARDLSTGNVVWSLAGETTLTIAPIVVGNYVYVGSDLGELYALDATSGQIAWMTNVQANIVAPDERNDIPLSGLAAAGGYLVAPLWFQNTGDPYQLVAFAPTTGTIRSTPPNDDFASPVPVRPDGRTTVGGSNVKATKEQGELNHAGEPGGSSVWYSWTAPADGEVTLNTANSPFDTTVAVYTGTSLSSLTQVAANDDAVPANGDPASGSNWSNLAFPVYAGTTYRIAVDGKRDSSTGRAATGTFKLVFSLSTGASPYGENDGFGEADPLQGQAGRATGTNIAATKEAGEPAHAGNSGGSSVWYRWTAPTSGPVHLDTGGSNFDTLLAVYTGAAVSGLASIAANDNASSSVATSSVDFQAVAGTTYQIAVDGRLTSANGSASSGQLVLNWRSAPSGGGGGGGTAAPANDGFAAAQTVAAAGGSVTGDTTAATREAGEPLIVGNPGGHSVWFAWTPTVSGTATIATAGSAFDTTLAVYTGAAGGSLTRLVENDDSGSGTSSSVSFAVAAGTTYRIQLDGYNGTSRPPWYGTYTLTVTAPVASGGGGGTAAPGNDAFAAAQTVAAAGGSVTGDTTAATRESGEPLIVGNPGGHSVWFAWTPTVSGTATIATAGSAFDTTLAVYTGTAVGSLTRLVENDDSGSGTTSSVSFSVAAGTTYRIQLDGYNGTSRPPWYGTYTLNVRVV